MTLMQDYSIAHSYIAALAGDPDTAICDFRMIHDRDKGVKAEIARGTLAQCWSWICGWNALGYGAFVCINEMDGRGRFNENVASMRVHVADLDSVDALRNYERAASWSPAPSFAVQSSPNKFHVYWRVTPYLDAPYYNDLQRKLRQFFDGDKQVIDPARVLRLPGTLHQKGEPHLITCWSLGNYGRLINPVELATALQGVNVVADHGGTRKALGAAELQAPALEWLDYVFKCVDPNSLERGEWIGLTAAIKQAFWSLTDEQSLYAKWSEWCSRYDQNDPAENQKQWHSIRDTELGWKSIVSRVPTILAQLNFQSVQRTYRTTEQSPAPSPDAPVVSRPPVDAPVLPTSEIITAEEQAEWFAGCYVITRAGVILTPHGRFMSSGQFNAAFGGKQFVISSGGKTTDEAWKAATRSTLWTVPKVDHVRFMPDFPFGHINTDVLGRKGVNTFIPINRAMREGDPSPFLRHMELMFPDARDRKHLLDYWAHVVRFPGFKVPWAPLIQSTEGIGKGVIKQALTDIIGEMYFHSPSASELVASGSKFNAWMRGKLFILVDEIRVDERRDMIEVLKPMISEKRLEVQGKGLDQDMEDNATNWTFFSNYKDAIPVNKNSRRFGIFYSVIQSAQDLLARGMNDDYFNSLFSWLDNGGSEIIAHYLTHYPIERGAVPMRAPTTSSTAEAQFQSRSPLEELVVRSVESGSPGFRGGWVSILALMARARKADGMRVPTERTIGNVLESMGYHRAGRSDRVWRAECLTENTTEPPMLYHLSVGADVRRYGVDQGYEI